MTTLAIHYGEDWAALYVDGYLSIVGDTYLAEERALELAGVTTVHDDAFMRGQTQAAGVAKTLDEVAEYARGRDVAVAEAARLRSQAADLLARANSLDGGAS